MSTESMRFLILVSLFGVVGVLSRVCIVSVVEPRSPSFPTGTFLINIIGSLLIGILFFNKTLASLIAPDMQRAIMVGLLGGFTTFSSLSLETLNLLNEGRYLAGFSYLVGSPVIGLSAAYLGMIVGRSL